MCAMAPCESFHDCGPHEEGFSIPLCCLPPEYHDSGVRVFSPVIGSSLFRSFGLPGLGFAACVLKIAAVLLLECKCLLLSLSLSLPLPIFPTTPFKKAIITTTLVL